MRGDGDPRKREPARDAAARIVTGALEQGRILLALAGGTTTVAFAPSAPTTLLPSNAKTTRVLSLGLRELYAAEAGCQPSPEALRVMRDIVVAAAGRLAGREGGPSVEGEDGADPADGSAGSAFFEREETGKPSQSDLVVELVEEVGVELWHTPDGDPYATTVEGEAREHRLVGSKSFKRWVQAQYFDRHGKSVRREALADALGVLEGRALRGPEFDVHVRIAGHEGKVFIDLADRGRGVVEISADGWRVIHNAPVRFRRPTGALALPQPLRGGSIEDLRPHINVPDDDAWVLLVGFIVSALHPRGPYFVLILIGEQGTAKSTATRLVTLLLDPKDTPLRRPPRDERDLAIAARNGRVVAFNNLSTLSETLSDALSSLATEGGFVTRSLYSDDEEARFRDRRPIVANGIPDFVTRGDLADRSIKILLRRIVTRRDEADVLARFERLRPRLLGALCDAVSGALRGLPTVVLDDPPRMADAARWVTAAEATLGWVPGTFVRAYRKCIAGSYAAVIEADPVAEVLFGFASETGWTGAAGDLFKLLKPPAIEGPRSSKDREWPKTAHGLASALRRLAPALRRAGIEVTDAGEDPKRRVRLWHIARERGGGPSPGNQGSQGSEGSHEPGTTPDSPSAVEPSAEPVEPMDEAKARSQTASKPCPPGASSLASLPSLPNPASPADDDTYTCPHCGITASDGHECPGGSS